MTVEDVCPEISILSSLLDGEFAGDERARVEQHAQNCPNCSARIKDLELLDRAMIKDFAKPEGRADRSPSGSCVTAEEMTSYLHDLLSNEERAKVENHLDGCDACLGELTALAKVETQLASSSTRPLPDPLRKRVEALWNEGQKAKERVLSAVFRLAGEGIEIIRDSLFPQGLVFQEVFAPAGAYRSGAKAASPSGITVKRQMPGFQFSLLVEREREDRAGLKVKLEDEKASALADRRVLLRREGVLLFSARTDADGNLMISSLEPGIYQLGMTISEKEYYVDIEIEHSAK
jgi:anti-sigma factor RsiW